MDPTLHAFARARLVLGGEGARRRLVASAFGDPAELWRRVRLPLFDPARMDDGPGLPPQDDPLLAFDWICGRRRDAGAFYTPPDLAQAIVDALPGDGPLWDPATGGGVFLRAALRKAPAHERAALATGGLFALDTDELSVHVAQAVVALEAGVGRAVQANIRVGNALVEAAPTVTRAATNPPFLTRLKQLTAIDPELARRLGAKAYTDVSTIIAQRMLEAAEHVGVILPMSMVAARDAAPLRDAFDRRGVGAVWTLPEGSFEGVGAPTIAVITGSAGERWRGRVPLSVGTFPPGAPWPTRLADLDLPALHADTSGRLADVATATADFRDEFYALQGKVREGGGGLRVHTSGLIDLGCSLWGSRSAKIHGEKFLHPSVSPADLHPRQRAQLAPKILVATQTRVLEAFLDPDGSTLAMTPVLVVRPRTWPLERILAVILSPVATLWALRNFRGAGLSTDAVKLGAKQLLELPLPAGDLDGIEALVRAGDWEAVARATTRAYGADAGLVDWWRDRWLRPGSGTSVVDSAEL